MTLAHPIIFCALVTSRYTYLPLHTSVKMPFSALHCLFFFLRIASLGITAFISIYTPPAPQKNKLNIRRIKFTAHNLSLTRMPLDHVPQHCPFSEPAKNKFSQLHYKLQLLFTGLKPLSKLSTPTSHNKHTYICARV